MTPTQTPKHRCAWVPVGDELYEKYHDEEWGVPVHSDGKMFEFLVLESAQAGLSWRTVLKKRENYRRVFAGFDPEVVARFDEAKAVELLANPGIIRNKAKINAAVNNAQRFLDLQREFGTFCDYIWRFVGGKTIKNSWRDISELPTVSKEAEALAQDLKERGFKFLGPTVCYAHLQATGLVNDHTVDCFRY